MSKWAIGSIVSLVDNPFILDIFKATDTFKIVSAPPEGMPGDFDNKRGTYGLECLAGPMAGKVYYRHQTHVAPASKAERLMSAKAALAETQVRIKAVEAQIREADRDVLWDVFGTQEEETAKAIAVELGLADHRQVLRVLRRHFDMRCY